MIRHYLRDPMPVERPISFVRHWWLRVMPVAVLTMWAYLLLQMVPT